MIYDMQPTEQIGFTGYLAPQNRGFTKRMKQIEIMKYIIDRCQHSQQITYLLNYI
jgi:hypothetical protein